MLITYLMRLTSGGSQQLGDVDGSPLCTGTHPGLSFATRGSSRSPLSRCFVLSEERIDFFFFFTTNLFFRSIEMSVGIRPWDAEIKPPPLPALYLILYVSFKDWPSSSLWSPAASCLFQEANPSFHHSLSLTLFPALRLASSTKIKNKINKKVKVYHFQRIGFAGSPCRKEALADMEDGLPSFVWTTRKSPASSIHHSVSQRGASDPAWHPPCRWLHCQLPSILPSIFAIYLQILLYLRRANNTQLRFQE